MNMDIFFKKCAHCVRTEYLPAYVENEGHLCADCFRKHTNAILGKSDKGETIAKTEVERMTRDDAQLRELIDSVISEKTSAFSFLLHNGAIDALRHTSDIVKLKERLAKLEEKE